MATNSSITKRYQWYLNIVKNAMEKDKDLREKNDGIVRSVNCSKVNNIPIKSSLFKESLEKIIEFIFLNKNLNFSNGIVNIPIYLNKHFYKVFEGESPYVNIREYLLKISGIVDMELYDELCKKGKMSFVGFAEICLQNLCDFSLYLNYNEFKELLTENPLYFISNQISSSTVHSLLSIYSMNNPYGIYCNKSFEYGLITKYNYYRNKIDLNSENCNLNVNSVMLSPIYVEIYVNKLKESHTNLPIPYRYFVEHINTMKLDYEIL